MRNSALTLNRLTESPLRRAIHAEMDVDAKEKSSPAPSVEPTGPNHDIRSADEQSETPKTEVNGNEKDKGVVSLGQKAANAKDPSRPRRKKARRACFACQRAHLTCGMTDLVFSFPFLFPSCIGHSRAFLRI